MNKRNFLRRVTESMDLPEEPFPGRSIIEIAGDDRVLIEQHGGVLEYSQDRIGVIVPFGAVWICGSGMILRCVKREQLVITGRIRDITLHRRNEA